MHNDRKTNLEFKITFSETNIRYLLGEQVVNEKLIDFHRGEIGKAKKELDSLKNT